MCACITRRQCLAKIICRLLTWNPQFHRKKRIFLLLLQAQLQTHLKKKTLITRTKQHVGE